MDQSIISKLSSVAKQEKRRSNKQILSAVTIYLGVDPVEHFPKVKDASGKTVKGSDGSDLRAEASDGWTYTFSEVGTSKVVKVVYPKQVKLEMMTAYQVSGLGYSITSGNMLFIDENSKITLYQ